MQSLFFSSALIHFSSKRLQSNIIFPFLIGIKKNHYCRMNSGVDNWTKPGYRKPLHWVFKVGSLEETVKFYSEFFSFKIFRHEEFESGCEATCNGPYGGAWSKTMIGYGPNEQEAFSLELTYNYGINSYERGNDLRYLAMSSSSFKGPPEMIEYDSEKRKFIQAPDGHWIHLIDEQETSRPMNNLFPFLFISLHVFDLNSSKQFYTNVLGGEETHVNKEPQASTFITWRNGDCIAALTHIDVTTKPTIQTTGDVSIELVELPPSITFNRAAAHGRLAMETEDFAPAYINDRISQYRRDNQRTTGALGSVLHGPLKLQPHGEEVVIVQDPDGHEICFVDARGFKTCTDVAMKNGGNVIDWEYRETVEKAALAKMSNKFDFTFNDNIREVKVSEYSEEFLQGSKNESPSAFLLDIYVPWCEVCAARKFVLQEVADYLETSTGFQDVSVLSMDGSGSQNLPTTDSSLKVMLNWAKSTGYPALFLIKSSDRSLPVCYEGNWSAAEISSWINAQLSASVGV